MDCIGRKFPYYTYSNIYYKVYTLDNNIAVSKLSSSSNNNINNNNNNNII